MICTFCGVEATPTLSQHLTTCQKYQECYLQVVAKKPRPAPKTPKRKTLNKPCARCHKAKRVSGSPYCLECKRLQAREHQSTRNGNGKAIRKIPSR